MNKRLQSLFDNLESSKSELLAQVKHLDVEQLNKQPMPEKWSIAQIIDHLILAEKFVLIQIEKRMSQPEALKKVGFGVSVKMFLLKMIVRLSLTPKVKAPGRLAEVADYSELENLEDSWAAKRQTLKEILENMKTEMLDKNLTSHPLIPDMTIFQGLGIIQGHFNIHKKQIQLILNGMKS